MDRMLARPACYATTVKVVYSIRTMDYEPDE